MKKMLLHSLVICLLLGGCTVTGRLQRRGLGARANYAPKAQKQEPKKESAPQYIEYNHRDSLQPVYFLPTTTLENGERVMSLELDEVVVVATPDAVCVRGASTVSERAWALGAQNQRLLLNMVRVDRPSDNPITDFDTILDLVAVPLRGVVPFDRQVHACLGKKEDSGKPLYKECIAAVAKRLQGEQVPLKVG